MSAAGPLDGVDKDVIPPDHTPPPASHDSNHPQTAEKHSPAASSSATQDSNINTEILLRRHPDTSSLQPSSYRPRSYSLSGVVPQFPREPVIHHPRNDSPIRVNRSPWPTRVSATRASANGARWEGRLDSGTVGGFGRLPSRRQVPANEMVGGVRRRGEEVYEDDDEDLDRREEEMMQRRMEGRERSKYYDKDDMYQEHHLRERLGRIPAPTGLVRAAAGTRGEREDIIRFSGERQRRRSRHRSTHYPTREADGDVRAREHRRMQEERDGGEIDVDDEFRKRGQDLAAMNKAWVDLEKIENEVLARQTMNDYMDPNDARAFQTFREQQESEPSPESEMRGLQSLAAIEKSTEARREMKNENGNLKPEAESSEDESDMSKRVAWLGW